MNDPFEKVWSQSGHWWYRRRLEKWSNGELAKADGSEMGRDVISIFWSVKFYTCTELQHSMNKNTGMGRPLNVIAIWFGTHHICIARYHICIIFVFNLLLPPAASSGGCLVRNIFFCNKKGFLLAPSLGFLPNCSSVFLAHLRIIWLCLHHKWQPHDTIFQFGL